MRDFSIFDQRHIIEPYNIIAEILKARGYDLTELDEDGVCNGLSLSYLLYAKSEQREEFFFCARFIQSLKSVQIIHELINQYLDKLEQGEDLWVAVDEKDNRMPFSKVINFLQGIQAAQKLQYAKAIGANWDSNYTFAYESDNEESAKLAEQLKQAKISDGKYMLASIGMHAFPIEKVEGGFYVFEPNNIEKPTLLESEDEVAKKIIANIKISGVFPVENKNVVLSISFLSYGEKNIKLYDAIAELEKINLAPYPELSSLISQLYQGKISCVDAALALRDAIEEYHDEQFNNASVEIKAFLENKETQSESFSDNPNVSAYSKNISLLFLAVQNNQISFVKRLLERHADITHALENGNTALILAVNLGHLKIVEELLKKDSSIVNQENKNNSTALIIAIQQKNLQIVKTLLGNGANPNHLNIFGNTPLLIAAQAGHLQIVQQLLNATPPAMLDSKTPSDETALHLAAEAGHTDVVKLLVERGAAFNISNVEGKTPILMAAEKGQVEVVELLLANGANSPGLIGTIIDQFKSQLTGKNNKSSVCAKLILRLLEVPGYTPNKQEQKQLQNIKASLRAELIREVERLSNSDKLSDNQAAIGLKLRIYLNPGFKKLLEIDKSMGFFNWAPNPLKVHALTKSEHKSWTLQTVNHRNERLSVSDHNSQGQVDTAVFSLIISGKTLDANNCPANSYVVVKENGEWKLSKIDQIGTRAMIAIDSVPGLQGVLEKLPKKITPVQFTSDQTKSIYAAVKAHHGTPQTMTPQSPFLASLS